MDYFVLIGDIEKSRDIKNRQDIQDKLEKTINIINATLVMKQSKPVAPFTVTIGDEFQAVFENPSYIMQLINHFEDNFYTLTVKNKINVRFRYGFGIGKISTKLNRRAAIGMDGPAFYNARKSIETAKKENKKFHLHSASVNDNIINLLLDWLGTEISAWNDTKKKAAYLYKLKQTQKEIAEKIKISQPAVSKIVNNRYTKLAIKTEKEVESAFRTIMD